MDRGQKKNKLAIFIAAGCMLLFTVACMLFGTPRGPLSFQPDALPEAQVGVPYEARISITGNVTPAGNFSVVPGSLPTGMTLETLEGEDAARIYGTPKEAGTYKLKVFVWCYGTNISGQAGEKEYTLIVK